MNEKRIIQLTVNQLSHDEVTYRARLKWINAVRKRPIPNNRTMSDRRLWGLTVMFYQHIPWIFETYLSDGIRNTCFTCHFVSQHVKKKFLASKYWKYHMNRMRDISIIPKFVLKWTGRMLEILCEIQDFLLRCISTASFTETIALVNPHFKSTRDGLEFFEWR